MRALVVDLNNFARYPTIAVGYLVAILRQAGMDVRVFSPLASGVSGVGREPPVKPWGLLEQRLRHWSALSTNRLVRAARARLAQLGGSSINRQAHQVYADFVRALRDDGGCDVVLVSTYLMYYDLCARMCSACGEAGVPVLIGGPYFAQPQVVDEWIGIPGLTAIIGGEVEADLAHIVRDAVEGRPLHAHAGVFVRDANRTPAPPLRDLDSVPFADYSDFPWHRYPNRIVPLISGRGCGWGACAFCSDVTSTAGRTFRSRSAENVLTEVKHQARRHEADLFVFTDLKLNSSLDMWQALLRGMQTAAPGSRWVAAVHVGARQPNGLSCSDLRAARAAGLVRITTGLESGSQRSLDRMSKGADLAVTSQFLGAAREAGISVRATMILGYPGDQAEDVEQSAAFVERHAECIERVSLNRFLIMTGTRVHRAIETDPLAPPYPGVTQLTINHRLAYVSHHDGATEDQAYRRQVRRLLGVIHAINRRPLLDSARAFEGVM